MNEHAVAGGLAGRSKRRHPAALVGVGGQGQQAEQGNDGADSSHGRNVINKHMIVKDKFFDSRLFRVVHWGHSKAVKSP
jgi:hypothetical protein